MATEESAGSTKANMDEVEVVGVMICMVLGEWGSYQNINTSRIAVDSCASPSHCESR